MTGTLSCSGIRLAPGPDAVAVPTRLAANAGLPIIARAHSDAQVEHLVQFGANQTIMGEREIAGAMLKLLRPPEPPAPESGEELASVGRGGRRLFTDPEWIILAAIRSGNIEPGRVIPQAKLLQLAGQLEPFSETALTEAIKRLQAKTCLTDLGNQTVAVTTAGFAAATNAPSLI